MAFGRSAGTAHGAGVHRDGDGRRDGAGPAARSLGADRAPDRRGRGGPRRPRGAADRDQAEPDGRVGHRLGRPDRPGARRAARRGARRVGLRRRGGRRVRREGPAAGRGGRAGGRLQRLRLPAGRPLGGARALRLRRRPGRERHRPQLARRRLPDLVRQGQDAVAVRVHRRAREPLRLPARPGQARRLPRHRPRVPGVLRAARGPPAGPLRPRRRVGGRRRAPLARARAAGAADRDAAGRR